MSDTLDKLARLRAGVAAASDESTAAELWSFVQGIETDLEGDPRLSDSERRLLQQLKSGLSDFIRAHREGLNPHAGSASVAITGLESSLKRRTTGADGWPLA